MHELLLPTQISIVAAGGTLILGMILGIWKFFGMATSEEGFAHPYVDIAHRAALLYATATLILVPLAQFNDWSTTANTIAVGVVVFLFVANILNYSYHGWKKDTTNQVHPVTPLVIGGIIVIIVGEIGGVGYLLAGFVSTQFF